MDCTLSHVSITAHVNCSTFICFFPKQAADCIPVVVLKRCPELSYTLAELFNKCLKEACFQDCFPEFKNVGERSIYS